MENKIISLSEKLDRNQELLTMFQEHNNRPFPKKKKLNTWYKESNKFKLFLHTINQKLKNMKHDKKYLQSSFLSLLFA